VAALTRRTQVLLDDARHRRLEKHAAARGISVAAVIRDAIDRAYPAEPSVAASRRAAAQFLLAAEPMPVEDWPQMKRQIRDELAQTDDRRQP